MPFIPHTAEDTAAMLARIGVADIERLFDEIPSGLRVNEFDCIGKGLTEAEISRLMHERASADKQPLCFLGAGAYDHYVPAAVWDIATRGEFYSAYTPYQAEASQGTLQVIYEFQSMVTSLTGLDVANASLYDGASAFAEACLMAVRANRKSESRRILVPRTMHPTYRAVAQTILAGQSLELVELPMRDGRTALSALQALATEEFAAVAVQQPNFFGALEPVDELTDWAHGHGGMLIAVANPIALAVLKPPGKWGADGADIACGEGQPLGIPLSAGGPYFGYMASKESIIRQMPGRIVGRTVDLDGNPGFTLTLQAREQHIRRSRATSNICTNQGLMVTAATIYMSLLGADGLRQAALACHANTRALVEGLTELPGITRAFDAPYFHEAVLRLDRPAPELLGALAAQGILGGYDLSADYPELEPALLVCATEARSGGDIQRYLQAAADLLFESGRATG
jgi:glycine dehydrogenase subunit 1